MNIHSIVNIVLTIIYIGFFAYFISELMDHKPVSKLSLCIWFLSPSVYFQFEYYQWIKDSGSDIENLKYWQGLMRDCWVALAGIIVFVATTNTN